jgi:hypothetical protein
MKNQLFVQLALLRSLLQFLQPHPLPQAQLLLGYQHSH